MVGSARPYGDDKSKKPPPLQLGHLWWPARRRGAFRFSLLLLRALNRNASRSSRTRFALVRAARSQDQKITSGARRAAGRQRGVKGVGSPAVWPGGANHRFAGVPLKLFARSSQKLSAAPRQICGSPSGRPYGGGTEALHLWLGPPHTKARCARRKAELRSVTTAGKGRSALGGPAPSLRSCQAAWGAGSVLVDAVDVRRVPRLTSAPARLMPAATRPSRAGVICSWSRPPSAPPRATPT
ncbi:hypothetical protein DFJ66_8185 [Saccharothrix variisporea]|uniref:Uncharacterized protein n=1 Tax=Saccharothrix variisporea TaxID=543527 RepID=A0A495XJV3_9PSEU|nr:hypothetical protein DFJ66_8185 [Saccharothrix variisporea]